MNPNNQADHFKYETPGFSLRASILPWDSVALGYPAAQIDEFYCNEASNYLDSFRYLSDWIDLNGVGFISARMPIDSLRLSFILEEFGFKFVEVVLHPYLINLPSYLLATDSELGVFEAKQEDLCVLKDICANSFSTDRFSRDPRLNSVIAVKRYQNWIQSSISNPGLTLLKITKKNQIMGFFLIEVDNKQGTYWHLTAIDKMFHGRGLGKKAWIAVLHYLQSINVSAVKTTIAASNLPALNLYAGLGFKFANPEATFHWMRR